MNRRSWLWLGLGLLCIISTTGCVRAARDTQGFAVSDAATINAPFEDAWQTAKAVLREKGLDLYTRDKRGVFVAFGQQHRQLLLVPRRTKYTVSLEPVSDTATKVTIESIRQVYGSTLLTYPGWHDRKASDHAEAQVLLKAIEAKFSGASASAEPGAKPAAAKS